MGRELWHAAAKAFVTIVQVSSAEVMRADRGVGRGGCAGVHVVAQVCVTVMHLARGSVQAARGAAYVVLVCR